jgi:hypothetical protein
MANADGDSGSLLSEIFRSTHTLACPHNQPRATCLQCQAHRIPRPKTFVESIRLDCKLIYERRNMVKMPAISTASFSLFLRSSLACLLYIITFRESAWYRLSGELVQQRVEASFPRLKTATLMAAGSKFSSPDLMKVYLGILGDTGPRLECYVDEWNVTEITESLRDHWQQFRSSKTKDWNGLPLIQAISWCLCVSYSHLGSSVVQWRFNQGVAYSSRSNIAQAHKSSSQPTTSSRVSTAQLLLLPIEGLSCSITHTRASNG